MKKITLVLLMLMSTAAWAETLNRQQMVWLKVYQDQVEKAKFAIKVGDNKNLCTTMAVAKHAAFNIGDESFYKNHLQILSSLRSKGAYCPEWN